MRRLMAIASLVALVAALGLVAGCGDSGDEEAQTPTSATTVANSAAQTDADGNTVTAPDTDAPGDETGTAPAEEPTDTAAEEPTDTATAAPAGDVAAGKTVFAANCTGCHMGDGTEAGGVGPQLSGLGLETDFIRTMVVDGGQIMPAGLVSGADLDNVVAYVESIQ